MNADSAATEASKRYVPHVFNLKIIENVYLILLYFRHSHLQHGDSKAFCYLSKRQCALLSWRKKKQRYTATWDRVFEQDDAWDDVTAHCEQFLRVLFFFGGCLKAVMETGA